MIVLPAIVYLVIAAPDELPLPAPLALPFHGLRSLVRRLRGSDQLTVVFLNDVHYDVNYLPTGVPSNSCRTQVSTPNATYLFGQYGCDTAKTVIASLFQFLAKTVASPDFVFIAGDFPPHGVSPQHPELLSIFQTIYTMVSSVYPTVPIYATMGNHDFYPQWGAVATDPDDFENFAKALVSLNDAERATFRRGGYFSHDFGSLRILFLNTVMYSTSRTHTGDPDPFGQFAWIEQTAKDALSRGMAVGAVMHIPSGVQKVGAKAGWYPEYIARYANITVTYNIQFALNGHSHLDQFLPTELAASPRFLLSAPAVSPVDGNNPGFRVYTFGSEGIVNYRQYYADILKNPTGDLKWQLEYAFNDAYRVSDLSPTSVAKAAIFARDDVVGKWQYQARLYNQAIHNGGFHYCALTCTTADEILNCQKKLAQDVKFS
jgi:hypothetical protein